MEIQCHKVHCLIEGKWWNSFPTTRISPTNWIKRLRSETKVRPKNTIQAERIHSNPLKPTEPAPISFRQRRPQQLIKDNPQAHSEHRESSANPMNEIKSELQRKEGIMNDSHKFSSTFTASSRNCNTFTATTNPQGKLKKFSHGKGTGTRKATRKFLLSCSSSQSQWKPLCKHSKVKLATEPPGARIVEQ